MYKLFVLAAVLATATAEGFYPAGYAGIHGGLYGHGYAGLAGYGAYGAYGYGAGLGHLGYAAPVAAAAPVVAAAAPVIAAPVANRYAVPAPRVLQEAPIVEKIVEPVEQWGYKIKY